MDHIPILFVPGKFHHAVDFAKDCMVFTHPNIIASFELLSALPYDDGARIGCETRVDFYTKSAACRIAPIVG